MSFNGYPNNSTQRKNSNSSRGIRPIRKVSIGKYLTDEFFNCDDIIFKRIADLYCDLYGVNAHNYMMKTFYKWKSGWVDMSGQTMHKILECVPRFLSDEKRFYILKCEVEFFLETTHYEQQAKNKKIGLLELNTLFEHYTAAFNGFGKSNLTWFLGKKIFNEEQIEQFMSVCRYSLANRLNLAYTQVQNDLTTLKSNLKKHDIDKVSGEYTVDFLNTTIEISSIRNEILQPITFGVSEYRMEGRFKEFAEKYILDELIKIDFSKKQGDAKAHIKSNDIDMLFSHYNEVIKGKNEVKISSTFEGEGGILVLNLDFTPIQKTIRVIGFSTLKLIGIVAIIATAVYFILEIKKNWIIWVGVYLGFYLISRIVEEIKIIKQAATQLKRNG